jgi:hypothetical protein
VRLSLSLSLFEGNRHHYTTICVEFFYIHLFVVNTISLPHRYQAATLLKKLCLKNLALAEVLQVLNIIINTKTWLVPHSSGWQPLSLNAVDPTTNAGGKA